MTILNDGEHYNETRKITPLDFCIMYIQKSTIEDTLNFERYDYQ